ncbi:CoxG family protein [Variovorax sp. HJSM1_2]|uniref:CoxG family protein n=1 Tax=Variovorax sp. HJSM1_2 TaxID=3366263 RepID=UPI003BC14AD9
MNYQGTQQLAHPAEKVWAALLDPVVLRQCIAGCEKFERAEGEDGLNYNCTVKVAIGPVSARFTSTLNLLDVVAPSSCTLQFSGQGGVAGFGKGEAKVQLLPQDGGASTQLDWQAESQVGGKLAQMGSRLIDAAVRKMSDDFFQRFAAQLNGPAEDAVPAGESPEGEAKKSIWSWKK